MGGAEEEDVQSLSHTEEHAQAALHPAQRHGDPSPFPRMLFPQGLQTSLCQRGGDLPHLSILLTPEPKRLTHSMELRRGERDLEMGKACPCYSMTLWLISSGSLCDCAQIPALDCSPVPLLEVGTSFFLTKVVLRNIL